jgi:hypothetical protein
VPAESTYLLKGVPRFDARGLQRCAVPGVAVRTNSTAVADFWRQSDGTIKLRIVWMDCVWSFEARLASGAPIPDGQESMDDFAWFVHQELYRWMTEDAADLPPFYDE